MGTEFSNKLAYLLERRDDEKCRRELASLLEDHPELIEQYVEQLRVHGLLEWSLSPGPILPLVEDVAARPVSTTMRRRMAQIAGVLMATAAMIAVIAIHQTRPIPLGVLKSAHDIVWVEGGTHLAPGERFQRGVLEASEGTCAFEFGSGVKLVCDAPFRMRIVDDMLVELEHGKLRATVPENARGFSVDTPDTFLVDQGTEFGVNAEAGDGTKVVVFQGEVDVYFKDLVETKAMRRLSQGEAAQLLSGRGSIDRVPQVTSGTPSTKWSANGNGGAIFSIRDNIRAADSLKYYNIVVGGLYEDVPAWVDRVHEWNGVTADGLPKIIRGADYAMTFNDDRYNPAFKMYVTVHRPATLYVFIDDRISSLPEWLLQDFEDTGEEIGLDEGWHPNYQMIAARGAGQSIDQIFSIWRREVPEPTELELGGFDAPAHFGMYGLAATPLE